MQYASFDRAEASSALRRAMDGQAIFAAQYNAIVALTGMLRDQLGGSVVRVGVQDTLGSGRDGVLVGWLDPSSLVDDRAVAAAALGYALRRLRSGHRFLRRSSSEVVPVGASWPERVAITGEPETAMVSPTAVPPDTQVELDPSSARDVFDAQTYAQSLLEGRSISSDLSSRVAWMAREYAISSGRAEWIAYAALAGGTVVALALLGAFRRSPAVAQQGQGTSLPGVTSTPYGPGLARPIYG